MIALEACHAGIDRLRSTDCPSYPPDSVPFPTPCTMTLSSNISLRAAMTLSFTVPPSFESDAGLTALAGFLPRGLRTLGFFSPSTAAGAGAGADAIQEGLDTGPS